MKRIELAILIGLILSITTNSITSFAARCDTVRQNTIRLHILANSDSEADQALKLLVRDAVLTQTADVFTGAQTKEEAVNRARENKVRVQHAAEETLRKNGCGDLVEVQVVKMFFATRQYGEVVMPAGEYDAIRILIGNGAGHNWWCVMFPPMCLPAAEQKQNDAPPTQAEQTLIPAQPEYNVKFAVVELYEKWKEKQHDDEAAASEAEAQLSSKDIVASEAET